MSEKKAAVKAEVYGASEAVVRNSSEYQSLSSSSLVLAPSLAPLPAAQPITPQAAYGDESVVGLSIIADVADQM